MRTQACARVIAAALLPMACAVATLCIADDSQPSGASGGNASPRSVAADPQASIAFANHGGIYDWRVIDDRTVLIQSLDRQWYKATLLGACINLPFAERIGFESNPDGSFDKFSAIKFEHQTCPLTSLVKTAAPAKKSKSHSPVEVTTAASAGTPPTPPSAEPTPPPSH